MTKLEDLRNALEDALDVFTTEDKVAGQLQTLWALSFLLNELGIDKRLQAPLRSVISNITQGKRKGAEKPRAESADMIVAAAALDTLMKAGMEKLQAEKAVVKAAGGAMRPNQLINYRENLQRKRAPAWATTMYWELTQHSAKKWGHLSKKEQIREALAGLHQAVVPAKKP